MTDDRQNNNWLDDLLVKLFSVLAVFVALLLTPGMLLVAAVNGSCSLGLDPGQMWSFSAAAAVAIFLLCRKYGGSWRQAVCIYLCLCALASGGLALCHFGLKCRFPATFVRYFLPPPVQQEGAKP